MNSINKFNQSLNNHINQLHEIEQYAFSGGLRSEVENRIVSTVEESLEFVQQNIAFCSAENPVLSQLFNEIKQAVQHHESPQTHPLLNKIDTVFQHIANQQNSGSFWPAFKKLITKTVSQGDFELAEVISEIHIEMDMTEAISHLRNAFLNHPNSLKILSSLDDASLVGLLPAIDPGIKDSGGNTLLHHLCFNENPPFTPRLLSILVAEGVDLNARNARGETPLHAAAQFSNPSMIAELLKQGADFTLPDHFGRIPLLSAIESEKTTNAALLKKAAQRLIAKQLSSTIPEFKPHPPNAGQKAAAIGTLAATGGAGLQEIALLPGWVKNVNFPAVNAAISYLSLKANLNNRQPIDQYNQEIIQIKEELKYLPDSQEGIERKNLLLDQLNILSQYKEKEKAGACADCMRNALQIGINASNAVLNQSYITSLQSAGFLKYAATASARLVSAVTIFQNWSNYNDVKARLELIQHSHAALHQHVNQLKQLVSSFPENSFEHRLIALKIKSYDAKIAHLETIARLTSSQEKGNLASSCCHMLSLAAFVGGTYGYNVGWLGSGMANAGMAFAFIPAAQGFVYQLKKGWENFQGPHERVSRAIQKRMNPFYDQIELSEKTAKMLGMDEGELQNELDAMGRLLKGEAKENFREILIQAGLAPLNTNADADRAIMEFLAL
ncbi:MAG: ankyrin repeat domain-containing protein [Parachlamydia sp.]|jgi:ankyrin repeat protein|nr:ankyrin repeat domain-containing protein [Parachlamydia sp.]